MPRCYFSRAPCLKSLRLISCNYVSNEGFTEAVKKLPLLEDLEVSLCDNVGGYYACGSDRRSDVFQVVGEVCPKLKHFRRSNKLFDVRVWWNKDDDVQGIATMHGLRSLQLFGHALTNEGLETILDGCPHLECLDIRHCFNIDMDEALHLKCAGIKTLRLPDDPTDDYDLEVHSPIRMVVEEEIVWDSGYYSDDSGDDDWDFYDEPSRYESDLDKYEKMLPLNMRTFLK